jgi:hypothetical protein
MTPVRIPGELRGFIAEHRDVQAVIQRIGQDTWDLLLIDGEGEWTRAVLDSKEAAESIARELDLPAQDSWDGGDLARRMNRHDDWADPHGRRRAI